MEANQSSIPILFNAIISTISIIHHSLKINSGPKWPTNYLFACSLRQWPENRRNSEIIEFDKNMNNNKRQFLIVQYLPRAESREYMLNNK